MPHAEIKCSSDLRINFDELFSSLEKLINQHDSTAGICKCRAYLTDVFKHSHILITISMLTKPHRDENFTKKLSHDLETEIKKHLKQECYFSFLLEYNPLHYVTNFHSV
ncbi:MAG: hypothetical protein COX62_02590 [Deltaproteobacteria bacterium CG_4_10_14_0_2_um_filter_43_8]|nr:MAG: hypothetical protein COV43_07080 [Deltaproteobacteria bacterium CG11_big_fil_rev_8_21_14_0_20_42_23]PJA21401.1 MAG: hypothetical protein COX62_02590 [Deltaproteobacteria bacterium CG_4_10_14_0_2_um_filter_43_8]PJC63866.1 MAG: hypothetical protein CO021_07265 [Deltaproteobacteria bacterium CG_4_9_14_0_2_um_filter_42_21]